MPRDFKRRQGVPMTNRAFLYHYIHQFDEPTPRRTGGIEANEGCSKHRSMIDAERRPDIMTVDIAVRGHWRRISRRSNGYYRECGRHRRRLHEANGQRGKAVVRDRIRHDWRGKVVAYR